MENRVITMQCGVELLNYKRQSRFNNLSNEQNLTSLAQVIFTRLNMGTKTIATVPQMMK